MHFKSLKDLSYILIFRIFDLVQLNTILDCFLYAVNIVLSEGGRGISTIPLQESRKIMNSAMNDVMEGFAQQCHQRIKACTLSNLQT